MKKLKDLEVLTKSLRDVHVPARENDFVTREDMMVALGCTRRFINKRVTSGKIRKLARGFISKSDTERAFLEFQERARWSEYTEATERLPYCLVPILQRQRSIWARARRFFDLQRVALGCRLDP